MSTWYFFYYACAFIAKVTFVNLFIIKYKIAIANCARGGISFCGWKIGPDWISDVIAVEIISRLCSFLSIILYSVSAFSAHWHWQFIFINFHNFLCSRSTANKWKLHFVISLITTDIPFFVVSSCLQELYRIFHKFSTNHYSRFLITNLSPTTKNDFRVELTVH